MKTKTTTQATATNTATAVTVNLAPFEFGVLSGAMRANGCASIGEAVQKVLEDSGVCTALLNNEMRIDGLDIA